MAHMSETLALALIVACAEQYEADVWIDPRNKMLRFGFDDPDEAEHFMNDLHQLGIPYDALTHLMRQ